MPKYTVSDAKRAAALSTVGGVDNDYVFLDTTIAGLTMTTKAPYWNPVVLDADETLVADTALEVEVPYHAGKATIVITSALETAALTVAFNAATATPITIAADKSFTLAVDKHYVGYLYLKSTGAGKVHVQVLADQPGK